MWFSIEVISSEIVRRFTLWRVGKLHCLTQFTLMSIYHKYFLLCLTRDESKAIAEVTERSLQNAKKFAIDFNFIFFNIKMAMAFAFPYRENRLDRFHG